MGYPLKKHASTLDIFFIFLRLGLTSFGGPIAQLGYFREEFVHKKKWVDDHTYSDLVALSQLLPGPLSSQVGIGLGFLQAGLPGAMAACLGFVLPSALALTLFGMMVINDWTGISGSWLHSIKVAVVAIVAQALWAMGKNLCPDKERATLAVVASAFLSLVPGVWGQVSVILGGALFGWIALSDTLLPLHTPQGMRLSKRIGVGALILFGTLLIAVPVLALETHSAFLKFFNDFYRTGAFVFGGGHVVLPLLQSQFVGQGLVSNDVFLAGYGAAQVIPGPLFTFAAYLGAVSSSALQGWVGALVAVIAIFLPGFLLSVGVLPFWAELRHYSWAKRLMLGVNAAVVGLLMAAFYNPVFTAAIHSPRDFSLAAGAFLLLVFWEVPSWLVVLLCVTIGSWFLA